jgi:thiol-disulfide isomerase/thioredoxin
MRKLVLSLFAVALLTAPVAAGEFNKKVTPGDKAPPIAGVPAVQGTEECTINLDDLKDEVVVVTFLANHCPVVVAYEDRLIDLAKQYEGKPVKFVAICCTAKDAPVGKIDDLDAIKSRVQEKGYNFVYGYDASGKIGKAYGAVVTPQTFVLDKDRVIRYTGAVDDNQNEARAEKTYLKNAIDAVLAGETVEVKETRPFGCGITYAK